MNNDASAIDRERGSTGVGWWFARDSDAGPRPISSFILKVASRCNLNCSYCYVYNLADARWRAQPTEIRDPVIAALTDRLNRYCRERDVRVISVHLHGGEPLLIGPRRVDEIATYLRQHLDPRVDLRLVVQTNGTLLSDEFVAVFRRHGIMVGLSLDGAPATQDSLRPFAAGGPSSAALSRAVMLLKRNPDVFGGLLSVIDLRSDPIDTYEFLVAQLPPNHEDMVIDFLLPHANYAQPPPGCPSGPEDGRYGSWLIKLFDHWYRQEGQAPRIRYFESIMRLLLRRPTLVETIGYGGSDVVVVETNGDIEAVDTLKSCYEGASRTGLSVFEDDFAEAERVPAVRARSLGRDSLSQTCLECALVDVCGGGYLPHRFSHDTGFLNPSVYCESLKRIIRHISTTLFEELGPNAVRDA